MAMDSDHINYLVFRYLQESGFQHSAFTFSQESGVVQSSVAGTKIPAGALIGHLQRALNYVQAEVNLTEDGRPAELEELESIEALNLIESVQPEVCEERRQQLRSRVRSSGRGGRGGSGSSSAGGDGGHTASSGSNGDASGGSATGTGGGSNKRVIEVPSSSVKMLRGHSNEVTVCSWNPKAELLASGSSDGTVRIWDCSSSSSSSGSGSGSSAALPPPVVLRHYASKDGNVSGARSEGRDVTALEWSPDGSLLATGSYDGAARVWSRSGDLLHRMTGHKGPIFSLKWNPNGRLLVTSSVDCSCIAWDPHKGAQVQAFALHTAPCVDVDWKNNDTFASCSTDRKIIVCKLGESKPLRSFVGHTDDVNGVRWDPKGTHLASCSDDCTARVWTLDLDSELHQLRHADKIYTLTWSRPSATSASTGPLLATASFDHTTKIWNIKTGTCIFTLEGHTLPVYSVAFSPNQRFIATGSFDQTLLVWAVDTGRLVATYHGEDGIYEVVWNSSGKTIAACYADHNLALIPFTQGS